MVGGGYPARVDRQQRLQDLHLRPALPEAAFGILDRRRNLVGNSGGPVITTPAATALGRTQKYTKSSLLERDTSRDWDSRPGADDQQNNRHRDREDQADSILRRLCALQPLSRTDSTWSAANGTLFVLREPAVRPNAEDSHVQVTPYCEGPGVDASSGLGANFRQCGVLSPPPVLPPATSPGAAGVGAGAHRWRCNERAHGCPFLPTAW